MSNLPTRLREMHASKTRHFTAPGGLQAWSIVATDERMQDLIAAAEALEAERDESDMLTIAHLDGSARADDRWRLAIREAAIREFAEWREHTSCSETVITGIRHLCERLGVKL
jgi:hypothetical protein